MTTPELAAQAKRLKGSLDAAKRQHALGAMSYDECFSALPLPEETGELALAGATS